MNIYEFAMKMEQEGAEYYRKASKECNDQWLKGIFEFLALEEEKHYRIFNKLKEKNTKLEVLQTETYKEIENVFEERKKEKIFDSLAQLETEVYLAAAKDERESIAVYEKMLKESSNEEEKRAISMIINEEERHLKFLEEVVNLMMKIEEQRK